MGYLIAVTLACILWSLWVRRITWTCRWEVAATLNIALQGCAVLLMSPFASATIGLKLYEWTGHYNLEDYLGHDCYIVAASAIVYNALGRLGTNESFQRRFRLYVELPSTLCIPLMLAFFAWSNGPRVYAPDFFDVPTDFWLNMYWLTTCGAIMWLIGYASRSLLVLRRDPRSRRMAHFYLAASGAAILACTIRLVMSFWPGLQVEAGSHLVWVFACVCGAVFAVAAAYSWMSRTRGFKKLQKAVKV